MSDGLPPVHSLADVAAALGETEAFVARQCRERRYPHLRGARGRVSFTAEQYAQILELRAQPATASSQARFAFAPRSRRAS